MTLLITPRPPGLDDLHPATFVQGWCLSKNGDCNGVVYSEGRVAQATSWGPCRRGA